MNYTENYQLPQWEETDRVLRKDFNTAMTKVDEAIAERGQLAYGSYRGTNQYGESIPCRLEFSFPPQVVILALATAVSASGYAILLRGQTHYSSLGSLGGSNNGVCSWEEYAVSWYSEEGASTQFNYNTDYLYLAIG